jgi:hypothetical protein
VPIELRFHVEGGGLVDLVRGLTSVDEFQATMGERWYFREPGARGPRGVHAIIDRPGLEQAFASLRTSHSADPWGSAGRFLEDLVRPYAGKVGAPSWVEMTPPNAKSMHLLSRMLPTAKFVHMIRDGRDVASSVVRRWWGPNDLPTAIKWWGDQMRAIQRSVRETESDRVFVMRLESLVGAQRVEAYRQLTDFLGLTSDPGMRSFFDTEISSEGARPGNWRVRLSVASQQKVDELYEVQLARLERAGFSMPPVL